MEQNECPNQHLATRCNTVSEFDNESTIQTTDVGTVAREFRRMDDKDAGSKSQHIIQRPVTLCKSDGGATVFDCLGRGLDAYR